MTGCFKLLMHLGYDIFEILSIFTPIFTYLYVFSPTSTRCPLSWG